MTSATLREPTLRRLWDASPWLTATGLLMLGLLAAAVAGLWLDPRTITGAPAWLKPAKFAASIAIYTLTLAWVFTYLPDRPRMRRWVGVISAVVFVIEIAIIDLQAWRGTTSHFNNGTTLDAVLFSIMGAGIAIQTLTSIAAAIALWRHRFGDRPLGWAFRLGMTITIVGALSGGLMTRPTASQFDAMRRGGAAPVVGAHTVGAPDGGRGLPGTNWSVEHGDLRVPHFLGLHALQAFALLALALRGRRWSESVQVRLVQTAAVSYGSLYVLLLWQALRGQSIAAPDASTLVALAAWLLATAAGCMLAARPSSRPLSEGMVTL
ncbi:MAG: hypothetical protein AB7F99_09660 [Vicinamibacterales bacterium]